MLIVAHYILMEVRCGSRIVGLGFYHDRVCTHVQTQTTKNFKWIAYAD